MNKEDIISIVKGSNTSENLKEMLLKYVDESYTAGFNDGMVMATKTQSQVFDKILGIPKTRINEWNEELNKLTEQNEELGKLIEKVINEKL